MLVQSTLLEKQTKLEEKEYQSDANCLVLLHLTILSLSVERILEEKVETKQHCATGCRPMKSFSS